jgi:hypothetical protein
VFSRVFVWKEGGTGTLSGFIWQVPRVLASWSNLGILEVDGASLRYLTTYAIHIPFFTLSDRDVGAGRGRRGGVGKGDDVLL